MPPDEPPFDDPPRPRRTPRTPAPGSARIPRPSSPDLFEAFEVFLQEYRIERADGISNRAILDAIAEVSKTLARIEGGNQVRDTFHAGNTGKFILPGAPATPVPPKSTPSVMTKLGAAFVDQLGRYLIPMAVAAAAGWLAAHGCRP